MGTTHTTPTNFVSTQSDFHATGKGWEFPVSGGGEHGGHGFAHPLANFPLLGAGGRHTAGTGSPVRWPASLHPPFGKHLVGMDSAMPWPTFPFLHPSRMPVTSALAAAPLHPRRMAETMRPWSRHHNKPILLILHHHSPSCSAGSDGGSGRLVVVFLGHSSRGGRGTGSRGRVRLPGYLPRRVRPLPLRTVGVQLSGHGWLEG